MDEAKLFKNGQSQAVRLPKAYRFKGDVVYIKRQGRGVLLLPKDENPWDRMLESLAEFSPDLELERNQGIAQIRPAITPPRHASKKERRR